MMWYILIEHCESTHQTPAPSKRNLTGCPLIADLIDTMRLKIVIGLLGGSQSLIALFSLLACVATALKYA
jgi:hypothetical protein